ncbi:MAG: HNH endonuclease [Acidimicrobiaceae bacterium]|nr:HNH endonuclease [Acidimicrobiaceae bacterium]MDE0516215.1 HNH endonuclease [Acidimicrobiaceae bacterium]
MFILTWKPPNWDTSPEDYENRVRTTARGDTVREPWSTGARKSGIAVGDEVVLLRQGTYRGIIASGHATSEISLAANDRPRVGVAWETWVHLTDRLPVETLREFAPRFRTAVRASGEELSPDQATAVRQQWTHWLNQPTAMSGDEAGVLLDGNPVIPEGAKAQVVVNRYERSRRARDACLAHHGYACKACGLRFEQRYGEIGRGFIHVHHTTPLSQVADDPSYKLNPVKDLVPICPNCHAMLHSPGSETLTVKQLRNRIRRAPEAASNEHKHT